MRQKLLKEEMLWKKALYCFLAVLIAFPLNLLITPTVSAAGSLNDAIVICDGYASSGKTVVMFPNKLIQNYQLQSGPVAMNIPAGAYEVRAVSQDGYNGRSGVSQLKEQWYAILSDSGNNDIITTSASSDLDDSLDYVINDEIVENNLVVPTDAAFVTAYHIKEDPMVSPNSVYPVCAVFDLISQDNPVIAITKTANPTSLPAGGGNVDYEYIVENTGNVPLSNVVLTDDKLGVITTLSGDDNSNSILETTEIWTYTSNTNLTATTTNIAIVEGYYNTQKVEANDDAVVIVATLQDNPDIAITKTANPTTLPNGGGNVTYTYEATNSGNVPLSNINLTDDKCSSVIYVSGDDNSDNILETTEIWIYTCDMNLIATTTNIATITGEYNTQIVQANDDAIVTVGTPQDNPIIAITKTANPTSLSAGGGNVDYIYVVTNPGNVSLSSVKLSDDKLGVITSYSGDDNSDSILDTTETWTYTANTNITASTTNVAIVEGYYNTQKVEATANASVSVSGGGGGGHHPAIRITKTPEPRVLPIGGGEVIYTYVVTNPGFYTLSNVTLVDDKCADIKFKEGDKNTNDKLERGEIWEYTCQTQLTETTINTVVVTGESVKGKVKDTTKATVSVPTIDLAIRLEKTANPESFSEKGGLVTYSYEVFNEGVEAISDVTLVDNKCAPVIFTGGDVNDDDKLDPTEVWTYTCESNITKTTTNIGTVRGQVNGKYATDTSDAIVRVEKVKGVIPKEMPKTGHGGDAIAVNNNNWQQMLFIISALLIIAVSGLMYKKRYQ